MSTTDCAFDRSRLLKICHCFTIWNILTAVVTHSDVYILRCGDFFVDDDNDRRTDQLLYPLHILLGNNQVAIICKAIDLYYVLLQMARLNVHHAFIAYAKDTTEDNEGLIHTIQHKTLAMWRIG